MSNRRLLPAQHEPTDVGPRLIWIGGGLLLAATVLMALIVLWLFPSATIDRTLELPLPRYPSPSLQPDPRADMKRFYDDEMRWLNSAGSTKQIISRTSRSSMRCAKSRGRVFPAGPLPAKPPRSFKKKLLPCLHRRRNPMRLLVLLILLITPRIALAASKADLSGIAYEQRLGAVNPEFRSASNRSARTMPQRLGQ
jgi:hypothetical protein